LVGSIRFFALFVEEPHKFQQTLGIEVVAVLDPILEFGLQLRNAFLSGSPA
jgi:hypothetical protein